MDEYNFSRTPQGGWLKSDALWIQQGHLIYKKNISRGFYHAKNEACKYIWEHYKDRIGSKLIVNGKNWPNANVRKNAFIIFDYKVERHHEWWRITIKTPFNGSDYSVFVPTESYWYKNRNENVFKHYRVLNIKKLKARLFNSPIYELAEFLIDKELPSTDEDFSEGFMLHVNLKVVKKN